MKTFKDFITESEKKTLTHLEYTKDQASKIASFWNNYIAQKITQEVDSYSVENVSLSVLQNKIKSMPKISKYELGSDVVNMILKA